MPSWPAVIVGAVIVGAVLGAAQKGDVDVTLGDVPDPTDSATPAPPSPDAIGDGTGDATGDSPTGSDPATPGPAPATPWPEGVWSTLPPQQAPRIALTFDDGPHPTWTPQVLDVLARHGATATFCVVGDQVAGNETILRRIDSEGHVLCNHTATHDYGLPARPPERIREEIVAVSEQIRRVVPDADIAIFRAPGGRFTPELVAEADALGLTSWAWSIDPQDWRTDDPGAIVSSVLDGVSPDAVVLLHDGGGDREATVAAVAEIIPVLTSVGYEFVGLPAEP